MNRFFVVPSQVNQQARTISIVGDDVKHIGKVLRLVVGDLVEVCDGQALEYIGRIDEISKEQVTLSIEKQENIFTEPPIQVRLYQGIPKATKMELIIQKTTEMGISDIIPVMTDRTIVQFNNEKDREKKVERWQKIADEASKQSKRGKIPRIHIPMTYTKALEACNENDLNVLAYEKEKTMGLKALIASLVEITEVKSIGIWIGPEGGFTGKEIEKALSHDVRSITLGPRILRTETAGFAVLSMLMYELGDLGGA
ncbi:protein of unknown function DUF558 [Alkaliphilus metalliredigens QYMF]|uniref:Ribosomal RNA small subunit methyltransferase E n=1 Tax=Alkaliphilus metalliredigens (strain QYMF) TaxID=293826 RepID=A6TSL7_ALKMQ|nr:16S rRNA (uracil(1498)-N(3))-methyltransferase [Alkaliphilus metalliredigens]ABR49185.1 protein of unknown function DUF558 [Alkaliphilus metalliredigens QYMF]